MGPNLPGTRFKKIRRGRSAQPARAAGKRLAFEALERRLVLSGNSLVINEFMASNGDTLQDEDLDYSDWIEIHNPTLAQVNLDGWSLTDDDDILAQWLFPAVSINPNDHLLVFASGKDRSVAGSELHTNFELASDGEYLALVEPDGVTIAHEFSPSYPKQFYDLSYGLGRDMANFAVPGGETLKYLVPSDGSLGNSWVDPGFDDSAWVPYSQSSSVVITEAGTGTPDYFELQNVSSSAIDTIGWVALANMAGAYNINDLHAPAWTFPSSMAPGELIYREDVANVDDIFWRARDDGWVMILDASGTVVDFVVWGYSGAELDGLQIDFGPFLGITPRDAWFGDPVDSTGALYDLLQRVGSSDHDNATDWSFDLPGSPDAVNETLIAPFALDLAKGLGFDTAGSGIGDAVQVDLAAEMLGINASAYVRLPFEVADPSSLDSLMFSIQYNDGFVAYINGQEVASLGAPGNIQWDSTATTARSAAESLSVEQIDLTIYLGLLQPGRNVLAIAGLNFAAGDADFLILPDLAGSAYRYYTVTTPAAINSLGGLVDYVRDTNFSVDRGFYDAPFSVSLSTSTPGAIIRYTTDGSWPSETAGLIYTVPISVDTTTTLRAMAYRSGYVPTNVDTQTYVFLNDVIGQTGAGFPAGFDYAMDPNVVDDPRYSDTIIDDLKSLPTMSIVMDVPDMFGPGGIYANPWSRFEKPTSVELFYPDGTEGFQINASIRVHGNASTVNRYSMRLHFKRPYGPTKLKYPLFGPDAADSLDVLVLRSGFTDNWTWPHYWYSDPIWDDIRPDVSQYIRDQWSRDTQLAMGQPSPHGTYVHLYVNGMYWGLSNPTERPGANFGANYFGGDKDDYDVIHDFAAQAGDMTAWNTMLSIAAGGGQFGSIATAAAYADVQRYVDVDNFIDYMILNLYGGNWDWPSHNWYASRHRSEEGRFRFYIWDGETMLGYVNEARNLNVNWAGSPGQLYASLRANAEFRMRFADRVQKHLFHDGELTPENAAARHAQIADWVAAAMTAESARWGDLQEFTNGGQLFNPIDHWFPTMADKQANYFPQRTDIMVGQFRSIGLYPNVETPEFNQHGGQVAPGFELNITAPVGAIYYTLDGSDPRLPGGAVSPDAQEFGAAMTLIEKGSTWKYLDDGSDQGSAWTTAGFDDGSWASGPAQLGYGDGDEATVVGYGPDPANKYITTYFRHTFNVDDPSQFDQLTVELLRDDGAVVYLNGQEVARSSMPAGQIDFDTLAEPTIDETIFFPYAVDPSLLVQGDNVIAVELHQHAGTSSDISFDLDLAGSNSAGMVVLNDSALVKARALSGNEWSALNEAQFITHQPANAGNFAITELNYHPYNRTADEINAGFFEGDFEFVELMNVGPISIDLFGVRFADGIDFDFTGGSVARLDPGQFVVIVSNTDAFESRYGSLANVAGQYTGSLNNAGERMALLDLFSQTIRDFAYGHSKDAGWPDRADGNGSTLEIIDVTGDPSDPDNWRSSSELLGTPGSVGSGPYQGILVNEVLTNTDDLLVDAIELYNPTDTDVVLDGWWLSDSANDLLKFQIPGGTTIPAYGYVTFYEGHYEGLSFVVDQTSEFGGTGEKDFALSGSRDDDVWLLADLGVGGSLRFADHVEFGAALSGEPFGRWPNAIGELYPMTAFTPNNTNSGPRPPLELVISELMYNPAGGEKGDRYILPERHLFPKGAEGYFVQNVPVPFFAEFFEIYNTTAGTVDLTGWRLRKKFDYDFAPGTVLGAGEALVIVSFDPADTAATDAFRSAYGIGPEVMILGNPNDGLSDLGERIQLQRPGDPPPNDPLYVPHVIEDEIDYLNTWHATTDGGGDSLNRKARTAWGNEASSWTPEPPTPGTAVMEEVTTVDGRYVFYNNSSYGNTIAPDKTALRPGEQATFANYTSYAGGINGIMIDVSGLAVPGAIDENDFTFKIGNDDTPGNWIDAPTPASIDATVYQIVLTWGDGAIQNTWLEVTLLATEDTDLIAPDVFYFGNAIGETGNCTTCTAVDAIDVLLTRQNPHPFFDPADLQTVYDFNRDRRVNAIDVLIARNNQTWSGTELELIDLSAKRKVKSGKPHAESGSLSAFSSRLSALDWVYEFELSGDKPQTSKQDDGHSRQRDLQGLWAQ